MAQTNYLESFRDFIGEDPDEKDIDISNWPEHDLRTLEETISEFDARWQPPEDGVPTIGVFQCHNLLKGGLRAAIESQGNYRFGLTWDIDYISRLLLYYPRVAIPLPDYPDFEHRFIGDLRHLLSIKPLIDAGAVVIVPAAYLTRIVGWNTETRESEATRLANIDKHNADILHALQGFRPFDDWESVSESRYIFEVRHNREHISVDRPLIDLNEDLMLATAVRSEILCPNQTMFSLMTAKFSGEYQRPLHDIWAQTVCSLPRVASLKADEVVRIRANEEMFAKWRDKLEKSLRMIRLDLEAGREVTASDRGAVIRSELSETANALGEKVKASSLKKHFEDGAVSFAVGALAASVFSATPELAIGTGALSAVLKFIYERVRKREPEDARLYSHLYTMFDEK